MRCPECDQKPENGHLFGCQRMRAEEAEARVAELEAALLACEHAALTSESPRDMQDDVVAAVERVMGKPPRGTGDSVSTDTEQEKK